jgi:hypothetical protein
VTRDEHITAGERWLTQAETMFDNPEDDGADVAAAASIAAAHFAAAQVAPVTMTMRQSAVRLSPLAARLTGLDNEPPPEQARSSEAR